MPDTTYSISHAARISGLAPSVLRVWETRYGWPCPKRLRNGYRVFSAHDLEELKHAAELVRGGMAISKLIIDGLPRWPAIPGREVHLRLEHARALPASADRRASGLRDQLLEAMEHQHSGRALEIVQLAPIDLRPSDEIGAVLAPLLVGLAELHHHGRTLPQEDSLVRLASERCRQLLRRHPVRGAVTQVVALGEAAEPLADLAALLLAARGVAVVRRADAVADGALAPAIEVGIEADEEAAREGSLRITALGSPGTLHIADLLAPGFDLRTAQERLVPSQVA